MKYKITIKAYSDINVEYEIEYDRLYDVMEKIDRDIDELTSYHDRNGIMKPIRTPLRIILDKLGLRRD